MGCLEPRVLEVVLFEGDANASGVSGLQRLFIKPGSPLVWVHVAVYFQAASGSTPETHDATDDVDLYTFVQDKRMGTLPLDSIVTGSQLPFTWEGVTGADGLMLHVSQGDFGQLGNLVAKVTFHPSETMDECTWTDLKNRAAAWVGSAQKQVVSV